MPLVLVLILLGPLHNFAKKMPSLRSILPHVYGRIIRLGMDRLQVLYDLCGLEVH